ncbi:DUF1496 domain-containing protein [Herbaspirillum huttiense]|uniref:DUF1496 domain-containing protein n=1 Tax=Herbaspirillum huttiense TaxID=863372 RepID=UPI0031DF909B
MSDKVDFRGDVENAVIGDVEQVARLSNVVNLHLSEGKKEVQRITDYQRKRINILVKEWAAICGDKEIEIYKIFIADYGIQYFRELPIEHYTKVKETLEGWIDAGTAKNDRALDQARLLPPTSDQQKAHECAVCNEKDVAIARAQKQVFVYWMLVLLLLSICGWLLYKMPAPVEPEQVADNTCYFEGKAYSSGGSIKVDGDLIKECIYDVTTGKSFWSKPR